MATTTTRLLALRLVEVPGLTVLVATHNPAVKTAGDRVVHLQDGQGRDPAELRHG